MRRKFFVLAAAFCMICLCAAGCGKKDPQTATLALASNPTTGYTWEVTQTDPIFDVTSEYVPDEAGDAVGTGGTETFVLTPKEKGETTVTFEYSQHWDGGETGQSISYDFKVDGNMQIEMMAMRASLDGDIDQIPEAPELVIK